MSYRGLKLTFACLGVALAAMLFLPGCYGWYGALIGILGGGVGGIIHFRDYYRGLQRFVRERDEFNRTLRER